MRRRQQQRQRSSSERQCRASQLNWKSGDAARARRPSCIPLCASPDSRWAPDSPTNLSPLPSTALHQPHALLLIHFLDRMRGQATLCEMRHSLPLKSAISLVDAVADRTGTLFSSPAQLTLTKHMMHDSPADEDTVLQVASAESAVEPASSFMQISGQNGTGRGERERGRSLAVT